MKLRRTKHSMPELNTASLPDLIFTVLFFFMIITHMRETNIQLKYSQPNGKDLTKIENKSSVIRVFIGTPYGDPGDYRVQVDNDVVPVEDVAYAVNQAKSRFTGDMFQKATVSFKADKKAPMWLVNEVKQQLREAGTLKINYSAYENKADDKANSDKADEKKK